MGEIACAAGYFDHSHLTAEFRALAFVAPASLDQQAARRDCVTPGRPTRD